jgi:hypothetical protein
MIPKDRKRQKRKRKNTREGDLQSLLLQPLSWRIKSFLLIPGNQLNFWSISRRRMVLMAGLRRISLAITSTPFSLLYLVFFNYLLPLSLSSPSFFSLFSILHDQSERMAMDISLLLLASLFPLFLSSISLFFSFLFFYFALSLPHTFFALLYKHLASLFLSSLSSINILRQLFAFSFCLLPFMQF